MSLERYQEIIQLVDRVERADTEFSLDLVLMAERIVLQRLTRSKDNRSELSSILQVIQQISAQYKHPLGSLEEGPENSGVADIAQDDLNLSSGFSIAVELLEGMDSAGLYKLISWLRNESSDANFKASDLPLANPQE
jgi:hypothetical protein